MGFDAAIVARVERRASLKRYASHPLFLFSAFETWFRHYDHSRPRFSVRVPAGAGRREQEVIDDVYFAICLNTNPYTYLGTRPLNLAPGTDLDTGLAMVSVRSLDFTTIVGLGLSALASGDHVRNSRAVDYRTDLEGPLRRGLRPVPLPGRRRVPRRGHDARVPPRAGGAGPGHALSGGQCDYLSTFPAARHTLPVGIAEDE